LRSEAITEVGAISASLASAQLDNPIWPTRRLGEITLIITDGTHQTPRYVEDGVTFLSAQNVKPFRFLPEVHRRVSREDFAIYTARNKPRKGDVLLTRVGAGIGEAAVIDQDIDFAIYVSVALIRPNPEVLSAQFLVHWLNSPLGRAHSRTNTLGRGHSQGNLNLNLLRSFPVPVPSLNEQERVVAELEEMQIKINALKNLQTETAAELEALLPAILDNAFKGEL
jgi:type I restriction enzyme S subunit